MRYILNKNPFLARILIGIVVLSFLFQNLAYSVPAGRSIFARPNDLSKPSSDLSNTSYSLSEGLYIPEQYGRIEVSNWQTDRLANQPIVVLVKDAHCNYEAQKNISGILDTLIRDYKVKLVCVEGASGAVNPGIIARHSSDPLIRRKITDKYLHTGLLTASEALSINKGMEPGFSIWGAEDLKLYLKDLQLFRDTIRSGSETRHFVKEVSSVILQLKQKFYPKKILEFDAQINKYEINEIPLTNFIKFLTLIEPLPAKKYPAVELTLKAIRLEEKIYFNKVEQERAGFIKQMEQELPKEDLRKLVKQSLLFRLGKIPRNKYYPYLEGLYNLYKGRIKEPAENLEKYFKLVKIQGRIDEKALFAELDSFEEFIYAKYLPNETAAQLRRLDKDVKILAKVLNLESNRADFAYYNTHREIFTPENLLKFIEIQAPLNNIVIPQELNDRQFLQGINTAYLPSKEFYRIALQRDKALVGNLLKAMETNGNRLAALVVGGFHTEGIKKILSEKNIRTVVITPSITKPQEDSHKIYLARMMDERIRPEMILTKLGADKLQAPLATGQVGIDIGLPQKIIDEMVDVMAQGLQVREQRGQALPEPEDYFGKLMEYYNHPQANDLLKAFIVAFIGALAPEKAKEFGISELPSTPITTQAKPPAKHRAIEKTPSELLRQELEKIVPNTPEGNLVEPIRLIKEIFFDNRASISAEDINILGTILKSNNASLQPYALLTLGTLIRTVSIPADIWQKCVNLLSEQKQKIALIRIKTSLNILLSRFPEYSERMSYIDSKIPAALKPPGSPGLQENEKFNNEYFNGLIENAEAKEPPQDVIVQKIQGCGLKPDGLTAQDVSFYTIDTGGKLGIPMFEGASEPQDLIYAHARQKEGRFSIYVTKAFWSLLQKDSLMLAFLIDHEWQEEKLGHSHRNVSQRAWQFLDEYGMNPFYRFYLDQLESNGQDDELQRLYSSQEHSNKNGKKFKAYIEKLLLGKGHIVEIAIVKEMLKEEYAGKIPVVINLYAGPYLGTGVKEVVDTFRKTGKKNGLDIKKKSIKLTKEVNAVTKKIRQALQGRNVDVSGEEWNKYKKYNEDIFNKENFSGKDVLIIHDFEFLGMVPFLKENYPKLKIIWHCHLDVDNPNPAVWDRIKTYVNQCDLAILQPREDFDSLYKKLGIEIPAVFAPPAIIDPISDKNKVLNKKEKTAIKRVLMATDKGLKNLKETPYFLYTGRIDSQKGIDTAMEAFLLMRKQNPKLKNFKLIIAYVKNKQNKEYLTYLNGFLNGLKGKIGSKDIHLLSIPKEGNHLIINYLQRNAYAGIQLSSKEGFGLSVAEMMYKGRPVIGTAVGGIETQIRHNTGVLVQPGKNEEETIENSAKAMAELASDSGLAHSLGRRAKETAKKRYIASELVLNYLYSIYLITNPDYKLKGSETVDKLIDYYRPNLLFGAIQKLEEGLNNSNIEKRISTMEEAEFIEGAIADMLSENGTLSCIVLEKLKNILWQFYRQGSQGGKWNNSVSIMNINLPIAKINTDKGMEIADKVKEAFFFKIERYIEEEKPKAFHKYAKAEGNYQGFSKTRLYLIGLDSKDIPEIMSLYASVLKSFGLSDRNLPIYIGCNHISLKKYRKKLMALNINEKSEYFDELITASFQEAVGMAEFVEKRRKISSRHYLSDKDKIMHLPWVKKSVVRLGIKKSIPEGEYPSGQFSRISHTIGLMRELREVIRKGGYATSSVGDYIDNLKKIFLHALEDIRYSNSYKRRYIDWVLKWLSKKRMLHSGDWNKKKILLAKAGDELWFYVKTELGQVMLFGELNKFNAFNDAYTADSADSIYHQILNLLRGNLPFLNKFYTKLYENPNSISREDLIEFKRITEFLHQINQINQEKGENLFSLDNVLDILQTGGEVKKLELIERIKMIDLIGNMKIRAPNDYTVRTESAKVKDRLLNIKLVKSRELVRTEKGKDYKIRDLPFHSSDKVKINGEIHRLKLYEIKSREGEVKRFVVYNYRIYTASGKGKEDEEDITKDILSHRKDYTFSPVVTTLGMTLTLDRAGLLGMDAEARAGISDVNAYQKKYMGGGVKDVSEIAAEQIMAVLKKHNISQQKMKGIKGMLSDIIISSEESKAAIDFAGLWKMIKTRVSPEEFSALIGEISAALEGFLRHSVRAKGPQVMSAVLMEILNVIPEKEGEAIMGHAKGKTVEKTLFDALKAAAAKKGIDANAVQDMFDLFKEGINILTMYPELDKGQIDENYFKLINALEQMAGISRGRIRNAIGDVFGKAFKNARETDAVPVFGSPLDKTARMLELYNTKAEDNYDLADVDRGLWNSDFKTGTVVDKARDKRNRYLSGLDAVSRDTEKILKALMNTPAEKTVKSTEPAGIILHIEDYITFNEDDTFSYKPGMETVFRQMEKGIKITFITPSVLKNRAETALKATGRFKKDIFISDTLQDASDEMLTKNIRQHNIVYLAKGRKDAKVAKKKLGIKSVIVDSHSAFHAVLIFAVLYARAGPVFENKRLNPEVRALIWHFLKQIDGYKDKDILDVISQITKNGFFSIKLIRIEDTLNEFQKRRIYISTAA